MSLRHSYTLLAPVYDSIVSAPIDKWRRKSLSRIDNDSHRDILITGIGSGLDIPYLDNGISYTGTDLTPAMLDRARERAAQHAEVDIELLIADSQSLPFEDASFDAVVMHLILAVVPEPERALQESYRVLRPGGRIYIFDKFLRPGQLAIMRRLLNVFIRHIATRTDVVFEDVHGTCPGLKLVDDQPVLANGWFRLIELSKDTREQET
jgi:ubiquinone/menaquinone biosynthesis C-methylase UbiE